jgi:Fatty acid desaturase
MEIALRDPTYIEPARRGFLERLALRLINDPRDLPFLRLMALLTVGVVATGVLLFVPGQFRWWLAAIHVALVLYFMGPFVLMLHCTSHRRLFRPGLGLLNQYIPWIIGPFFGESPETYFAHHVGMHHPENNLEDDLSTTMFYRRDRVLDFLRYFFRFFFMVTVELSTYFVRTKRRSLMVRCLTGEFVFLAAVAALLWWNWEAAVSVFVMPYLVTRFGMMAGNWAQHAFIDRDSPDNCYRNSITCINSGYNRRCFNDGYHIGHHLKQTRHWTEMPEEFRQNLGLYSTERAVVFEGLDFFLVWALLMFKRYDVLADRFVALGSDTMSKDEVVALLKSRTSWTVPRPA